MGLKKSNPIVLLFIYINGREDRIRTCDPLVPNQVHYQAVLLPDIYKMVRPKGVEPLTFRSVV